MQEIHDETSSERRVTSLKRELPPHLQPRASLNPLDCTSSFSLSDKPTPLPCQEHSRASVLLTAAGDRRGPTN